MKLHHLLIAIFAVCLGASHYLGYTPIALSACFLLASVIAYYLYAKDKAAAKAGAWRVPERTLHLSALLCGWPGALVAQERLRHKTIKTSFRAVFWLSIAANLAGVIWLHSPQGNAQLRSGTHQLEDLVISSVPYASIVSTVLVLTHFRAK